MENLINTTPLIDSEKKNHKLNQVISILKDMDIDGETMEDILDKVGMREQVVHQILESEKYIAVKKLWDDVNSNETLWCPNFDAYYNHTFLQ